MCFLVRRERWEPSRAWLQALEPAVPAGLEVLIPEGAGVIRAVMARSVVWWH